MEQMIWCRLRVSFSIKFIFFSPSICCPICVSRQMGNEESGTKMLETICWQQKL